MILSAYLRVYLPDVAVGDFISHEDGPEPGLVHGNEHFMWVEPLVEDAFTIEWEGRTYVCPRFPRLRMLEGMVAFNKAFPGAVLIPEDEVESATAELSSIRRQSPRARSHILTSPWHVPIRWFAAFVDAEREAYDTAHGLSIRYRTLVGDGVHRVESAVGILEGAGFQDVVIHQVRGLEDWLEEFPGDALLELDYARVAELFTEGDLVLDESAAEVAASLRALELGNFDEAGTYYAAVARRWGPIQALSFMS